MNYQRSAGSFGDDIVVVAKGLEPDLNGAFGHSGVLCNRADAAVKGSSSPVGVDDEV